MPIMWNITNLHVFFYKNMLYINEYCLFDLHYVKARFFLLVDLWEFFFRSRVGGRKKINIKALKMTS